jgi:hypothetical protein
MSDMAGPGRSEAPQRSGDKAREVAALMARGQRLAQTPAPPGGRPLEWYVQAYYLGDFAALAAVRAQESQRRAAERSTPAHGSGRASPVAR